MFLLGFRFVFCFVFVGLGGPGGGFGASGGGFRTGTSGGKPPLLPVLNNHPRTTQTTNMTTKTTAGTISNEPGQLETSLLY